MKHLCLFVLIFLLFSACKKEEAPIEKYPMKYIFINNGDTAISSVHFYCATIYPTEEISQTIIAAKWRPIKYWEEPEKELHDYDSILVVPEMKVYSGCSSYLSVTIWNFDTLGIERPRSYSSNISTIQNANDCTVIFSWPEDTSKFHFDGNHAKTLKIDY